MGAFEIAVYHEEGRATPSGSAWQYEYYLKDHLGNTRVIFSDTNNDDIPEILQEADYYPFGMRHQNATATNHYLYNGKELNEDLGLDWYDYGFRWYDAEIGRFPSVDPIADRFPFVSPFNYAENKPINGIDLHGLQWIQSINRIWASPVGRELGKEKIYGKSLGYWHNTATQEELGDFALYFAVVEVPMMYINGYLMVEGGRGLAFRPVSGFSFWKRFKPQLGRNNAIQLNEARSWIKYIWNHAKPIKGVNTGASRGEIFEDILSHVKYSDATRVGHLNNGYFPTIDFIDDCVGVSLKTTKAGQGSKYFAGLKDNIDDLVLAKEKGQIGRRTNIFEIDDVRLDIAVPKGYDKCNLEDVLNYAKQKNVNTNIFHIEDFFK